MLFLLEMSNYNYNNVFYKIISGTIEVNFIKKSEHTMSLYDINPCYKIHALVIPLGKYINFSDFQNNASQVEKLDFWTVCESTISTLNLRNGYRLITNSGLDGEQSVPHFHVHILGGERLKNIGF